MATAQGVKHLLDGGGCSTTKVFQQMCEGKGEGCADCGEHYCRYHLPPVSK